MTYDLQIRAMPDGTVEQWSYLATGQTSAYTSPIPYTVTYVYDDAGRLTTVDYPSGTDTAFAYDDADRHTQMTDATGTTSYTYDAASQLTQFSNPTGTVVYGYNAAGQRSSLNYWNIGAWSYSYDSAGRLSSLTNRFGEATGFTYDALSRLSRKTFHSGAYEDYAYDSRSRPTSVTVKNSSGSTLRSQSYAYDAASRITGHTLAGVATAYAYDDADRLVSETRTGYSGTYTYDANGNRLTRTVNGVAEAYVHDAGDKLTSVTWNGGSKTFWYDAAGRTTSVVTSAGTTTLAYDFESRLVSMAGPGLTASYAYNGLDSRRSKTVNGSTRSYLRDGAYSTGPLLHGFALVGRSRLRMRAYRWFPLSPAPLPPGERGSRSWASVREHGVTKYLHSGLKNVDAQSSGSQSITATRVYDAFGNVESSSGSWTGAFGYGGPYGYQSTGEGGLMLLGHRYYDPSTGRFLTRDPIQHGRNWYAYVGGSPLKYSDPSGLIRIRDFEFTLDVVIEGIKTGAAGLANGMTGGRYRGDRYRDHPGFGFAVGAGKVAIGVLAPACGMALGRFDILIRPYPNAGGFGLQLISKGKVTPWRLDFHPWKQQPRYKWPHYHRPAKPGKEGGPGESPSRHRPWEGW